MGRLEFARPWAKRPDLKHYSNTFINSFRHSTPQARRYPMWIAVTSALPRA